MSATSIRQQLHQYVDQGDEKLLKLFYALAKEYNSDKDFEFTSNDIQQFYERSASWIFRSNSPLKIALYCPLILDCHS